MITETENIDLIIKAASGDREARLELVKDNLELVIEIAANHASLAGGSFAQGIQAGALAVIKAAGEFHECQGGCFADHVRQEVTKAVEGIG